MHALRSPADPARVAVVATSLLIAAIGLIEVLDEGYEPRGRWVLAVLLTAAALLGLRRAPLVVLVSVFALQLTAPVRPGVVQLDAEAVLAHQFFATLAAAFAVGLLAATRTGALAMAGVTGVYVLSAAGAGGGAEQWRGAWFSLVFLLGAWGLAVLLRRRTERAHELEEETTRLSSDGLERARAAVAEERARIARELHDAVAHSVSVMVLQVGAVRRTLRGDQADQRELLVGVERTGREAVGELHRMLGILRRADEGAELAPQPSLARVEELVASVRAAGLDVELAVDGTPRKVPAGLELSAYRVVQEALTNALKHAGGAHVRVRIGYEPRHLRLDVVDDGSGTPTPAAAGSARHGLIGMHERVSLYGGDLHAAPEPGGGFGVRARLPIDAAS